MTEKIPSQPTRRQLNLILPEAQRSLVEPIRQELDPKQHALIPAHVTLCRDDELPDLQQLTQRLERLDPFLITMRFGQPQQLTDGCVLLRPTAGIEQFQALRQLILGTTAREYGAHLTLLHPRNASGIPLNLADVAHDLTGLAVTFNTVTLVEQYGFEPWQVKNEYGSAI